MLTVRVPLADGHDRPDDREAWFLESLAELVDAALQPLGAEVGGIEEGRDECGLCLFGDDAGEMAAAVVPLLKRHCPAGTVLEMSGDHAGPREIVPLFPPGETPAGEPLPVASPEFAWRPVDASRLRPAAAFAASDRHVFRTIATCPGIAVDQINAALDAADRTTLPEADVAAGVDRLVAAGYVETREEKLRVAPTMAERLPRTAAGNVSWFRSDAWHTVEEALFSGER